MGFRDVALRPCDTDIQRFFHRFIACAMSTDIGHPVLGFISTHVVIAIPGPVDESRESPALVHVPAFVLITQQSS